MEGLLYDSDRIYGFHLAIALLSLILFAWDQARNLC